MPPAPDYASRRRAVIRRHHPDVGGDPETLHRELDRLDREFGRIYGPAGDARAAPRGTPKPTVRPTSRLRRLRRQSAATIATLRARLPKSVPGSRRYFDI